MHSRIRSFVPYCLLLAVLLVPFVGSFKVSASSSQVHPSFRRNVSLNNADGARTAASTSFMRRNTPKKEIQLLGPIKKGQKKWDRMIAMLTEFREQYGHTLVTAEASEMECPGL